MHRPIATLKYIPAVLWGLLVIACAVSIFWEIYLYRWPFALRFEWASIMCEFTWDADREYFFEAFVDWTYTLEIPFRLSSWVGRFSIFSANNVTKEISVEVPIPFFLTLLLPVAVGCLNRFRFSLWSYFAWTALIAAELAFYLNVDFYIE